MKYYLVYIIDRIWNHHHLWLDQKLFGIKNELKKYKIYK